MRFDSAKPRFSDPSKGVDGHLDEALLVRCVCKGAKTPLGSKTQKRGIDLPRRDISRKLAREIGCDGAAGFVIISGGVPHQLVEVHGVHLQSNAALSGRGSTTFQETSKPLPAVRLNA